MTLSINVKLAAISVGVWSILLKPLILELEQG